MPESWDANNTTRATAWLQRAESLPEGREREACLTLAEGYVRLAELIEAQDAPAAVAAQGLTAGAVPGKLP